MTAVSFDCRGTSCVSQNNRIYSPLGMWYLGTDMSWLQRRQISEIVDNQMNVLAMRPVADNQ